MQHNDLCSNVVQKFDKVYKSDVDIKSYIVKKKTACRLVCRKLAHNTLLIRKANIDMLLKNIHKVNGIKILSEDDLASELHTCSSEP